MALMRVNVNKVTNTGLTAEDSMNFTHGLGAAPDIVRIRPIVTFGPAGAATDWWGFAIPVDATSVTVINQGSTTCPNFEVVAIRLHTMVQ